MTRIANPDCYKRDHVRIIWYVRLVHNETKIILPHIAHVAILSFVEFRSTIRLKQLA